jgi:hypothetical protein
MLWVSLNNISVRHLVLHNIKTKEGEGDNYHNKEKVRGNIALRGGKLCKFSAMIFLFTIPGCGEGYAVRS